MWESDGSSVMGDNVWNLGFTNLLLDNLAEFESSFFSINSVWLESSLDVDEDSEMLVGLFNGDNVVLSERISWVSSDLSVDLDESGSISNNLLDFLSGESILKSLMKKNVKRKAFVKLMWTSGWSGGINTLQFTKIPVLWSCDSLHDFSLSFIAL